MQHAPRCTVSHGGAHVVSHGGAHVVSLLCRWAVAWRSHRLAGLALLLFLPAHVTALTPITNSNIGTAATAWVTDPATTTTTYGNIVDWDTAAVTSIASLFYPTVAPSTSGTAQPKFNGDISKWNVASVSNMYQVRLDSV